MTHSVDIQLPAPDGKPGRVVVDGVDLSGVVSGVTFRASARGDERSVVVEMARVQHAAATAEGTAVELDADTRMALRLLGWQPIPNDPRVTPGAARRIPG